MIGSTGLDIGRDARRRRDAAARAREWATEFGPDGALDFRIRAAFGLVWGPIITSEGAQAGPRVLAAMATFDETDASSGWGDPCPRF